jgi:hypothetical protein
MSEAEAIYARGLRALVASRQPFLVGGGFALFAYLGRWRTTKDIDIFVRPDQIEATLGVLARAGFHTTLTDPTWLGKAIDDGALIDIIFCSYNGLFPVDDSWYANGRRCELWGVPVRMVGPEEMIVSKCFVAARDRFDGADVSWLIRACGRELDWDRIESMMRDHWQVLLWQLLHFLYVFPSERRLLPVALVARLMAQLGREVLRDDHDEALLCRGPMLDPKLYRAERAARGEAAPAAAADER